MNIIGVGTDIVEVLRVRRLIDQRGQAFLQRWFRPPELATCHRERDQAARVSALLAAKEAAFKSLGGPDTGSLPWRNIEIIASVGGTRGLLLHGPMRALADSIDATQFHVSISYDDRLATAVVVATKSRLRVPPAAG